MAHVIVVDAQGTELSPCSEQKARRLVADEKAEWISRDPLSIRLMRTVNVPVPERKEVEHPLAGRRVLLHICCAPCATYTVQYLCSQGAAVTGYWYNPNIHPYEEYRKRRRSLVAYAQEVGLPVIWEEEYSPTTFLRAIAGQERFGERCRVCYALRLSRTARIAQRRGFAFFTTTLLISPYQDQEEIHRLGRRIGKEGTASFYFENLRRGFARHHEMAKEHRLYRQRYCGCLYSAWEARDPLAATHARYSY